MKKIYLSLAVIITILLSILPFAMYFAWLLEPKKELNVAIIDKTVLNREGYEHKSLNWILNNERYCKPDGKLYSVSEDYYGLFPLKDKAYAFRDFQSFDSTDMKNFVNKNDAIFITDTYGLYKKEWYGSNLRGEYSPLIYGATTRNELRLLGIMKSYRKLIIAEFNTIAAPTLLRHRIQFEEMFGMKWTGWTGRFFDNLDTTKNEELPIWVIRDYKEQHENQWPFTKSGIVFVKETGQLEIFEDESELNYKLPEIITSSTNQRRFGVPEKLKYSYWFDIMRIKRTNNAVSVFHISCNAKGDSMLKAMDIPNPFPAVIEHYDKDYKFYYFCGDFSDNPIELVLSKLYGITNFRWIFYSKNDVAERESFFWLYYQPLVKNILNNYYNELHKK